MYRSQTCCAFDRERVGYVGNIDLDPEDGTLRPGSFFVDLGAADGRVASSMAHHAVGGRVYLARGPGDEANLRIHVCAPCPGDPGTRHWPTVRRASTS